eukprot:109721-Hanusia_phi.AAC.6
MAPLSDADRCGGGITRGKKSFVLWRGEQSALCFASQLPVLLRSRIEDVIINEGVGYATVTYYIGIITKSEKEMLLGFSTLIPCLDDLLTVFRCLRKSDSFLCCSVLTRHHGSIIFGDDISAWKDEVVRSFASPLFPLTSFSLKDTNGKGSRARMLKQGNEKDTKFLYL